MNSKVTNLSEIKSPTIVWKDVNEKGRPLQTLENIEVALEYLNIGVKFNQVSKSVEVVGICDQDTELDVIVTEIASKLTRIGLSIADKQLGSKLYAVAVRNAYNPLHDYLEECKSLDNKGIDYIRKAWECLTLSDSVDKEEEQFLYECFKIALVNAYQLWHNTKTKQLSQEFVPVLQGKQGIGKTRFLTNLLPCEFVKKGLSLDPSNKDSVIQATSCPLSELGELESTTKKEQGTLKAFLSDSMDIYRRPYGSSYIKVVRTTFFVGSVNQDTFLNDDTGSRRFVVFPLKSIEQCNFDIRLIWKCVADIEPTTNIYANYEQLEKRQAHNEKYNLETDTDLIVSDYISKPTGSDIQYATSTEIADYINSVYRGVKVKPTQIGKSLKKLGYDQDSKSTRHGNKVGKFWYIKPLPKVDSDMPF